MSAPPRVQRIPAPLAAAHCEIQVDGVGLIDMEEDYLPNVIRCENGGANLEALKAQAIAARSVAYYAIETDGSICDSQGCQVYSCAGAPDPIHIQAVEETSGQYLMYNSTLTYGFYVAGDNNTSPPACVGVSGATEHWVTYNDGLSGTNVEQTDLGFVHEPGDGGYGQNRGCMSQWGARCLENDNGIDVVGILQFYYGADIEIVQAEGECVLGVETAGADESSTGDGDPTTGPDTAPETTTDPETTGGSDPTGVSDSAAGDSDPTDPTDPTDAGGTDAGPGSGATAADAGALPDGFGGDEGKGCGCNAGRSVAPLWLLLVLFAGVRRRRLES